MKSNELHACLAGAFLIALLVSPGLAFDRTWTGGAGNSNWFDTGNWSGGNYPQAGEAATITNGSVLLTSATAALSAFTLTNAMLVFSNWNTMLIATTVTVQNLGTLTLPPAFTTNQMSNNIYVVCSNFTLNVGGTLLADERGYAQKNGPGRGTSGYGGSGGGGYGGKGGKGGGGCAGGGNRMVPRTHHSIPEAERADTFSAVMVVAACGLRLVEV